MNNDFGDFLTFEENVRNLSHKLHKFIYEYLEDNNESELGKNPIVITSLMNLILAISFETFGEKIKTKKFLNELFNEALDHINNHSTEQTFN